MSDSEGRNEGTVGGGGGDLSGKGEFSGFEGGGNNTEKNAESKQDFGDPFGVQRDPNYNFDTTKTGVVTQSATQNFIERQIQSVLDDPLGALINLGLGFTPAGTFASLAGAGAKALAGPLEKNTSVGQAISQGIRAAIDGGSNNRAGLQNVDPGLAGQPSVSDLQGTIPGEREQNLFLASAPVAETSSSPPTVSPSPTQVQQPLTPTASPGLRTTNPFVPQAPLQQSIGSIWI